MRSFLQTRSSRSTLVLLLLFRPVDNAVRLNESADRMGMPHFPVELFVEGLKQLVSIEQQWIPPMDGSALYLRPFMYADEPFIGMRAATSYKFIIITSPAGPFFSKRIKLWAEKKYIRAANFENDLKSSLESHWEYDRIANDRYMTGK